MNKLRKRTAFLLIDHRRIFNQNPSKRSLMDHIKSLQERVDELEKIVKGGEMTPTDVIESARLACETHFNDADTVYKQHREDV